jgi:hypothetical protein
LRALLHVWRELPHHLLARQGQEMRAQESSTILVCVLEYEN